MIKKYIRVTVWQLVEALVGLHVERHSALVAFETRLVPYLVEEKQIKVNNRLIKMREISPCPNT